MMAGQVPEQEKKEGGTTAKGRGGESGTTSPRSSSERRFRFSSNGVPINQPDSPSDSPTTTSLSPSAATGVVANRIVRRACLNPFRERPADRRGGPDLTKRGFEDF